MKSKANPFRSPALRGAAVVFACFTLLNPCAQAADQVWIGSADDHNVTTPSNWVGGAPVVDNWSPFVFGSDVVDGTMNLNRWVAINSITGAVTVNGGILAPGASIQCLTTGALTLNTGSTFEYEMDSRAVPSVAADFQKVFGLAGNVNLVLTGNVYLTLTDLAGESAVPFANGTTLTLINYAGMWNNGFFTHGDTQLENHAVFTAGFNTWQITYDATSGGLNFAGEYTPASGSFVNLTAVPEPTSLLALGYVLASGTFLRRRR